MKASWHPKHPYLASIFLHGAVIFFIFILSWSQNHTVDEIPIEITEFIRNLGEPSSSPESKPLKKKSDIKTAETPSEDSDSSDSVQSAPSGGTAGEGESVSEDYEVSEMPILLNEVRVPYPSQARTRNIQGNVVFDLLISSEGKVRELKVVSSPDPILTESAQKAVELFKFRPARMGDKSVAIRIRYTYRFQLQ